MLVPGGPHAPVRRCPRVRGRDRTRRARGPRTRSRSQPTAGLRDGRGARRRPRVDRRRRRGRLPRPRGPEVGGACLANRHLPLRARDRHRSMDRQRLPDGLRTQTRGRLRAPGVHQPARTLPAGRLLGGRGPGHRRRAQTAGADDPRVLQPGMRRGRGCRAHPGGRHRPRADPADPPGHRLGHPRRSRDGGRSGHVRRADLAGAGGGVGPPGGAGRPRRIPAHPGPFDGHTVRAPPRPRGRRLVHGPHARPGARPPAPPGRHPLLRGRRDRPRGPLPGGRRPGVPHGTSRRNARSEDRRGTRGDGRGRPGSPCRPRRRPPRPARSP